MRKMTTIVHISDIDKNRLKRLQSRIKRISNVDISQQDLLTMLLTLGEVNEDELIRIISRKKEIAIDYETDPLWLLKPIKMGITDNQTIDKVLYEEG